eukprot:4293766-Pyramimonas_sp.AAC.1
MHPPELRDPLQNFMAWIIVRFVLPGQRLGSTAPLGFAMMPPRLPDRICTKTHNMCVQLLLHGRLCSNRPALESEAVAGSRMIRLRFEHELRAP